MSDKIIGKYCENRFDDTTIQIIAEMPEVRNNCKIYSTKVLSDVPTQAIAIWEIAELLNLWYRLTDKIFIKPWNWTSDNAAVLSKFDGMIKNARIK